MKMEHLEVIYEMLNAIYDEVDRVNFCESNLIVHRYIARLFAYAYGIKIGANLVS